MRNSSVTKRQKVTFVGAVGALFGSLFFVLVWFDIGWIRIGVVAIVACVLLSVHLVKYGPTTKYLWLSPRRRTEKATAE